MKELFVDTANIDDIKSCLISTAIRGVTTNPSLISKNRSYVKRDGLNDRDFYFANLEKIVSCVQDYCHGHISVEVISKDTEGMISEALSLKEKFEDYSVHLHVKIPVTYDNLHVISTLKENNINVNATCCMTALQGKMAVDAGANCVSFFFRRMIDAGENFQREISQFRFLVGDKVSVICGSIRKVADVFLCWSNGADIVTASPIIIKEMVYHHKTEQSIEQFNGDIDKWLE